MSSQGQAMKPKVCEDPLPANYGPVVWILYWGERDHQRGRYRKFFHRKQDALDFGRTLLDKVGDHPLHWPDLGWQEKSYATIEAGEITAIRFGKEIMHQWLP
jgi:hypothetical protein